MASKQRIDWEGLVKEHGGIKAAARATNRSVRCIQRGLRKQGVAPPDEVKGRPVDKESMKVSESKDGLTIDVRTFTRITTGNEAIQKAGFDPAVWEPSKVEATSWEVAIKDENGDAKVVPLWRVHVSCKRRLPTEIENAADELAKRVFGAGLDLPPVRYKKPKRDPSTLIVGLVDHHFGKLAWAPEVGENYDLKIAERLWAAAIDSAISQCHDRDIAEIVLPIGNDMGHVDTKLLTTEAGTPMDADGRYEKIAGIQEAALINAIERCRATAPVKVIHVPGNHDRTTSWWLCRVALRAFAKTKHVQFDTRPTLVKYHNAGKCLWGFAHGDGPKGISLVNQMPQQPAWGNSTACRDWITGHLHTQKTVSYLGTHEQAGMTFRVLPSLCASDAWHVKNGFVFSQRATQNLLYSHKYGLTAIFHEPANKLLGIN